MIRYRLLFALFALLLSCQSLAQQIKHHPHKHHQFLYDSIKEARYIHQVNRDSRSVFLIDSIYSMRMDTSKFVIKNKTIEYIDDDVYDFQDAADNLFCSKFHSISISHTKIDTVKLEKTSNDVFFTDVKIKDLDIISTLEDSVTIVFTGKNRIDSAWISNGNIIITVYSPPKVLFFTNCVIDLFAFDSLPKTLIFQNTKLLQESNLSGYGTNTRLGLKSVNINNLRIENYDQFRLDFSWTDFTYDEKVDVYSRLLENFKSRNQQNNYVKLDKEFQAFKLKDKGAFGDFANWVVRIWWDYGYNKELVLLRAIELNFIFFIINIFLFSKLINEGYQLQKFLDNDLELRKKYGNNKGRFFLARIPYIFLYTGYIFWGWKLDLQNIQIRNVYLFGYVLLQYLTGIVCLGYIVNLVITR